MNNAVSRRALPGASLVASGCALLLSLACSDSTTQKLSGTQAGPAHTLAQAAVQTDLTATDTFANGTHSYTATLPPATVVGSITQRLEGSWDANLQSIREPPIHPQYWSIDYYAGSTKLPKVPATASEWAQVSRVVATGNVQVEALDGERQALVSILPAPPPKVAPSFSGGSTGDGWDLFFDPAFTRVFNIHHHGSPTTTQFPPTLMCRNLEDSTTCPGFPITLTQTSHRSTGRIDLGTNKLW